MTIFDQINQIPMEDLLHYVGITFRRNGNTLNLFENGNETDGWKADLLKEHITDFSGKRAFGDRLTFIMRLNNLDKGDAVKWFVDNFHLVDEKKLPSAKESSSSKPITNQPQYMETSKEVKEKVLTKWNGFPKLNEKQREYLQSRAIDPDRVTEYAKDHEGNVACALYDLSGIISIQNRSITEKKFMIEKGTNSKGVFITNINKDQKKVYVVEGMFDFLSLAQFPINVIGLKSATDGMDIVKAFYHKGYQIIMIPDNDEAGHNVLKHLEDIKYSMFDLAPYEVKDINELLVQSQFGEGIIDIIEDERTREKSNIDGAFDKFFTIQDTYKSNGGHLGQPGPFPLLDKYTQGIIKGKVYTIGGFSNTGKSQLSYEYAGYFVKEGKKVMYISTEVDTGLLLGYIAKAYHKKDFGDILAGKFKLEKETFKDLSLYDNVNDIDAIVKLVDLEKPDVIFIDFLQALQAPGSSEYERLTKIITDIQQMAIRNNNIVFCLSQVNNDSRNKEGSMVTLKGSGALWHSSDVIFILYEEASQLKLSISKNKFGKKFKEFALEVNFNNGEIKMSEESFQKKSV